MAMDAPPRRLAVVSDDASFPTTLDGRLGGCFRGHRGSAENAHDRESGWLNQPSSSPFRRRTANSALWEIEDAIRQRERMGDFGPDFVALARRVYQENDRRAVLKRDINVLFGSVIVEEKHYSAE
jgi:hypothetical protein